MLTMVHGNPARVEDGTLRVDRKFLTGMQKYVEQINAPLTTVHPKLGRNSEAMDTIEIPVKDLGFGVMTIDTKDSGTLGDHPKSAAALSEQIARSNLIYGGSGLGSWQIAKRLGIPYILMLEYDLRTQLTMQHTPNLVRRGIRSIRGIKSYVCQDILAMRSARAIHCNGYPMYEESRFFNDNRLLYFDSRMSADLVIADDELASRFRGREDRPLRLLFSGRYERMKGADDIIRVAIECLRRGLNIEMHTYGQGNLREKMLQLASQSPVADRIHIHEPIPFPDLVKRSREFDLFVCCHIQGDPSCTYLESFGAGLPIVGYANRMWQRLSETSHAGYASPTGEPTAVVENIARLLVDPDLLSSMSKRARSFALAHTFEQEFSLRTNALNQELARIRQSAA
jgi:glycosyltransferase involved in cell wall biosynthesis